MTYVSALAFALSLLAGAAEFASAQRRAPRDRGGTSLLLEVRAEGARMSDVVGRAAAVIRRRCARLGVYCRVGPGGAANRLALRFSATKDSGRVKQTLLAQGLELRAVVSPPNPHPLLEYATRAEAEAAAGGDRDVFPYEEYEGETYIVAERAPIITGDDVRSAVALRAQGDGHLLSVSYEVDCRLRPAGGARLKAWTRANNNRYVAVVFDGRALSAPYIKAPIWLNVVVSGGFDRRQAEDLAVVIGAGNLPAPVSVIEETTYP